MDTDSSYPLRENRRAKIFDRLVAFAPRIEELLSDVGASKIITAAVRACIHSQISISPLVTA